jgi:hypothetical protein
MSARSSPRAHRVEVADKTDPFAQSDYASAFAITYRAADGRSAEQWARTVFEGAPALLRRFVIIGWRYGLGLRLGPPSSGTHILGWEIVSRTPEAITLAVRSPLLSARKIVRVDDTRVVMATFVRHERALGRILWAVVVPVHHRIEPYLLTHAATDPS